MVLRRACQARWTAVGWAASMGRGAKRCSPWVTWHQTRLDAHWRLRSPSVGWFRPEIGGSRMMMPCHCSALSAQSLSVYDRALLHLADRTRLVELIGAR